MDRSPQPSAEAPARHHLLWVTLVVAAAYLPLIRHLAWPINAYLLLLLALRLAAIRWPAATPGAWSLGVLAVAGVVNCLNTYHAIAGQTAGTALFSTMLVLKLLELKGKRDVRVAAVLVGFLMVLQFLFDQSPLLAGYLALVLVALLGLLVELNGGLGSPTLLEAARVTIRLCAQALPLTLVLFALFPRLNAPLWNLGLDPDKGRTGMSGTLEPGAISELVINGELAFRVRFDAAAPSSDRLYWRGPVLWRTDGRRWLPASTLETGSPGPLSDAADVLGYEVTLEPTDQHWLFVLDMPLSAPAGSSFGPGREVLSSRAVGSHTRYRAVSALDYRTAIPDERARRLALETPGNVTARMRDLASRWAETGDDWRVVQAGLRHFNQEPFHYTLSPPRLGSNPTDQFLFETRQGFCEHYASSFALMMRLAGVPSRVVLGYLGGEPNRIGGYHMVWQSDAHAWVEVLISGRGWVRVDPTAAVAPNRVDNSSASRLLGANAPLRFELDRDGGLARLARNLRLWADTMDAAWQDWVIGFTVERQYALLDRLGLGALRELGLATLMLAAGALVLGLIAFALVREDRSPDPLDRCYQRFCRRLAAAGLPRRPSEGPWAYSRRVSATRPDLGEAAARFIALYIPLRFGPKPDPGAERRLADELRRFRPRRSRR